MEIRLVATSFDGVTKFAKYKNFWLENEADYYCLHAGVHFEGYSTVDWVHSDGMQFTTPDVDRDLKSGGNCAEIFRSSWWMTACYRLNFNGPWQLSENVAAHAQGIIWYTWKGYALSLKTSTMSIREIND